MTQSGLVSPRRPALVAGRPALDANMERYVVKPGGSAVVDLEAGDVLELALVNGGQTVELVAFRADGKPATAALGLTAKSKPDALGALLSEATEDAERIRFGLFRRGCDVQNAKAARLFGKDAPAGSLQSLTLPLACTLIVSAPTDPMAVWEQCPPGDVLVLIRRARPMPLGVYRMPEPLAEPRLDITIDIASAQSFEVYEGEYIQIVDVAGRQCSDFIAFQRKALDKGRLLGLDSTTTRSMTGRAYPAPGLASKFFDADRNALVEVVQDTVGRHDTFNLACTSRYYEDMGYFGHANCSDNFNAALRGYGIEEYRGWPAINFFYNTNVDALNTIWFDEPWSRAGDYVLMRALTDLVCATSSCPSDIDPANGWRLTPIQVRVYPKTALFKRAIGHRMTPDSPLALTKDSGFHPRTSKLTRAFGEYKGYWVPQHFVGTGAIEEYWTCRERVVVMDLSALRKLEIMGPDAESFLQGLFPRDVRRLSIGQIYYTPICYEHGGMIDDGTLFRLCVNNFRWVGGDDASVLWIQEQAAKQGANVVLKSATDQIHNIAIQGPKSREVLRKLLWTPDGRASLDELGVFRFTIGRFGGYEGTPVVVSRTGYTGELGYEVFCHPNDAPTVWDSVMIAGHEFGIRPFGLEALDMVRIEAGLVFGGHDFDSTVDPFEAGISFTIPTKKEEDYIGKAALLRRRENPSRKLVGLRVDANVTPSHGDRIFNGRAEIGVVTSAMRSPLLKATIALARVDVAHAALGAQVEIGRLDGQQKRLAATQIAFPFYDPDKTRVRS